MKTVELKEDRTLKSIIVAAFPNYKKRSAFVSEFHPGVSINSYWDGGSKDEYAIVHLASLRRKSLPTSTHPYFDVARHGVCETGNADVEVDHVGNIKLKRLPEGFALVRAGTFCGKPATAHVYFPAQPKLEIEDPQGVKQLVEVIS